MAVTFKIYTKGSVSSKVMIEGIFIPRTKFVAVIWTPLIFLVVVMTKENSISPKFQKAEGTNLRFLLVYQTHTGLQAPPVSQVPVTHFKVHANFLNLPTFSLTLNSLQSTGSTPQLLILLITLVFLDLSPPSCFSHDHVQTSFFSGCYFSCIFNINLPPKHTMEQSCHQFIRW